MQDDNKEWLSALVDEHADLRDLAQVIHNDENRDTWYRYNLIRDVMREETADTIDLDLLHNIESAVAEEPEIVSLAAHRTLKQRLIDHHLVKKIPVYLTKTSQLAVAAAVAFFTVTGVQQYQNSFDSHSPLPVLQTVGPVNGTISPVNNMVSPVDNNLLYRQQLQQDILLQQQRIKALLADHQKQLKQHANKVEQ